MLIMMLAAFAVIGVTVVVVVTVAVPTAILLVVVGIALAVMRGLVGCVLDRNNLIVDSLVERSFFSGDLVGDGLVGFVLRVVSRLLFGVVLGLLLGEFFHCLFAGLLGGFLLGLFPRGLISCLLLGLRLRSLVGYFLLGLCLGDQCSSCLYGFLLAALILLLFCHLNALPETLHRSGPGMGRILEARPLRKPAANSNPWSPPLIRTCCDPLRHDTDRIRISSSGTRGNALKMRVKLFSIQDKKAATGRISGCLNFRL